ncbi:hypothetical protein SLV14_004645 [Streptomyces sp. Je 1-4]|nr:hypothetical protein SLV14_004645 [Streptomyces sp. Je 1-4]UZQ38107.1 hypothetical protein SLV14N_004645 [Streptomyces sp. Je 1-4] [Streptomyces sp. Je 1-4 4N24]UZQ45524.1 hypothetical protein SLV14NA_004645 [Streptomyces sp. Je 1-4] [Streptomyces sp. Je 1-4 4N24_ara]
MPRCIARIFEPLLRLLLPSLGRHRAVGVYPAAPRAAAPAGCLTRVPVRPGEDTVMVRPYVVAHERRQRAQRPGSRRRTLWLAVDGVVLGPRPEHGVEVAAP